MLSDGLAGGADGFHRSFQLYFGALESLDPQLHLIGVVDVDALGIEGMCDGVIVRHRNLNLLKWLARQLSRLGAHVPLYQSWAW